jgi:hypothetical protein
MIKWLKFVLKIISKLIRHIKWGKLHFEKDNIQLPIKSENKNFFWNWKTVEKIQVIGNINRILIWFYTIGILMNVKKWDKKNKKINDLNLAKLFSELLKMRKVTPNSLK